MPLLAATTGSDHASAHGLMIVGLFLLAGFAAHVLGRRVHIPRVTLLLLLGFLAGPAALQLIPDEAAEWFPLATDLTLSIIGFQLGERFLGKKLRQVGATVFAVSLTEVLGAAAAVALLVPWVGVPIALALLLASVAPASDPAATLDVVHQEKTEGPVTDTLLGVVAIDDAWGVMLFSVLIVVVQATTGQAASFEVVRYGLWEVLGGLLLGVIVGLPMAWLTGRIRPGQLTIVETLGFVLLCSGLALRFQLSYILACMAMGATVSNVAKHHDRPFHAIEEVEQPFLIVFFLLAGFHFDPNQLWTSGLLGLFYVMGRAGGLVAGGYLGGLLARAHSNVRTHIGWCLLPQGGVALGLALMVSQRYPQWGPQVLSVIVGTTIVFEVVGPILTRWALDHAGELPEGKPAETSSESHEPEGSTITP